MEANSQYSSTTKLYRVNAENTPADLICEHVELAESFWARGKGLLGRKSLPAQSCLWIKPCNNIHTFFMKFTIDCVFVNKKLQVEKVESKVRPFKIKGPFWKAHSVFEFSEGTIELFNIQVGDQLYVVN